MKVKMTHNNNDRNLFQCLGICQRLFNFIVNNIFFIGLKRVATTSHPMRQGPTTVPILSTAKPNRSRIEHHHGHSQAHYEKPAQIEARSRGPTKMVGFRDEEEEDEMMRKRKGKGVVMDGEREEVILQNYPPRSTTTTTTTATSTSVMRQRQVRPLFDVAVNINEKSDAFIRSRKEAMRRNCS